MQRNHVAQQSHIVFMVVIPDCDQFRPKRRTNRIDFAVLHVTLPVDLSVERFAEPGDLSMSDSLSRSTLSFNLLMSERFETQARITVNVGIPMMR